MKSLKSKLANDILRQVIRDRKEEKYLYEQYENKRELREKLSRLDYRVSNLIKESDCLMNEISKEKKSIPEVDVKKKYGEFVLSYKKKE